MILACIHAPRRPMFHNLDDDDDCGTCEDFKDIIFKKNTSVPDNSPPDKSELGRATWTFLHTMAANYPLNPTTYQKNLMKSFIEGLGEFYPCKTCAQHLKKLLHKEKYEVKVGNRDEFSDWMCRVHNVVNKRLGKEIFDCNKRYERWKYQPKTI